MSRKFFSIENLIEMVYQFIMGEKYKSGGVQPDQPAPTNKPISADTPEEKKDKIKVEEVKEEPIKGQEEHEEAEDEDGKPSDESEEEYSEGGYEGDSEKEYDERSGEEYSEEDSEEESDESDESDNENSDEESDERSEEFDESDSKKPEDKGIEKKKGRPCKEKEFLLKRNSTEIQVVVDNGYLKFADEDFEAKCENEYDSNHYSNSSNKEINYDKDHIIEVTGIKDLYDAITTKLGATRAYTGVSRNLAACLLSNDNDFEGKFTFLKQTGGQGITNATFHIESNIKEEDKLMCCILEENDYYIFNCKWGGSGKELDLNECGKLNFDKEIEVETLKEIPLDLFFNYILDSKPYRTSFKLSSDGGRGISEIFDKLETFKVFSAMNRKGIISTDSINDKVKSCDAIKFYGDFEAVSKGSILYFYIEDGNMIVKTTLEDKMYKEALDKGEGEFLKVIKEKELKLKDITDSHRVKKEKLKGIFKVLKEKDNKIYADFSEEDSIEDKVITIYRNGRYVVLKCNDNKETKLKKTKLEGINVEKLKFIEGKYYEETYEKNLKINKGDEYLEKYLKVKPIRKSYRLFNPSKNKKIYFNAGGLTTTEIEINDYCDLYNKVFGKQGAFDRYKDKEKNFNKEEKINEVVIGLGLKKRGEEFNHEKLNECGNIFIKKGLKVDKNNKLYAQGRPYSLAYGKISNYYVVGPSDDASVISEDQMEKLEIGKNIEDYFFVDAINEIKYISNHEDTEQVSFEEVKDKLGFIKKFITCLYKGCVIIKDHSSDEIKDWIIEYVQQKYWNNFSFAGAFEDSDGKKKELIMNSYDGIVEFLKSNMNGIFEEKKCRDVFSLEGKDCCKREKLKEYKYYIEDGINNIEGVNKIKVYQYGSGKNIIICIIKKENINKCVIDAGDNKQCINIKSLKEKNFDTIDDLYWLYNLNGKCKVDFISQEDRFENIDKDKKMEVFNKLLGDFVGTVKINLEMAPKGSDDSDIDIKIDEENKFLIVNSNENNCKIKDVTMDFGESFYYVENINGYNFTICLGPDVGNEEAMAGWIKTNFAEFIELIKNNKKFEENIIMTVDGNEYEFYVKEGEGSDEGSYLFKSKTRQVYVLNGKVAKVIEKEDEGATYEKFYEEVKALDNNLAYEIFEVLSNEEGFDVNYSVEDLNGCTYYVEEGANDQNGITAYYSEKDKVFCLLKGEKREFNEAIDSGIKISEKKPGDIKKLLLLINLLKGTGNLGRIDLENLKKKANKGEASKKN